MTGPHPRTGPDSHVWYVSYGSNLLAERFSTYLEGGVPEGRVTAQRGARDPSRWTDERALTLPHRLFFAGDSVGWGGGGVAFITPEPAGPHTRGRAYRITIEQFQDVLAQESGRPIGSEVDLTPALAAGSARLGEGNYDLVIHLGNIGAEPLFTFTTPDASSLRSNPPGDAYRATVVRGLVQCHLDLDLTAAEAYVRERAGEAAG